MIAPKSRPRAASPGINSAQGDSVFEIRLLGPLEVRRDGRLVELPSGLLRALLAILALSADRPVAVDALAERLWADTAPREPRKVLHTYVSRLRAHLGADLIETVGNGYRLRLDRRRVDALRLRDLVRATDDRDALAEALDLWRDRPFQGLGSPWLVDVEADRLTGIYLDASERRIELDLANGDQAGLVDELHGLTDRYPLRESLWALRMRTLHGLGRTAEAIELYGKVRALLAEQLGVEPGPALREMFAVVLATERDDAVKAPVPRQLPLPRKRFTGRTRLLAELGPGDLVAVHGPGGVGKTSLAVHWAHRVRARFPDGQLFLDLRGHGSDQPTDPAAALAEMLRALSVPPRQIPDDVSERGALWRTVTADRRILVVLDNALDSGQVRPLLPGPGPKVVVTSRTSLSGLATREGARRVAVARLDAEESAALLAAELDRQGVAHDPATLAEIGALCDGLPLALTITAERAARADAGSLAQVAVALRDRRSRLDALHDEEDPLTSVRAALATSYDALDTETTRLFRVLGLHPGADISVAAALAMAGPDAPLAVLEDANLIQRHQPERFRFHDLVRLYAYQLAERLDGRADRDSALTRMFSWYLHSAAAARRAIGHPDTHFAYDDPAAGMEFADAPSAVAWFTAERHNLAAAIREAARGGRHETACTMAYDLSVFLNNQHLTDDAFAVLRIASRSAETLGDSAVRALCATQLADTYSTTGSHELAIAELDRAAKLWSQAGNDTGIATTMCTLGREYQNLARFEESLEPLNDGLALAEGLDSDLLRARLLNNIAMAHQWLGRFDTAAEHARRALDLDPAPWMRPALLDTLGQAYTGQGSYDLAAEAHHRALALLREQGVRWAQPYALHNLGLAERGRGRVTEARSLFSSALRLIDELGDAEWPNRAELLRLVAELDAAS